MTTGWERVTGELDKRLDDKIHVKQRDSGQIDRKTGQKIYLSYVEGWDVIGEANKIFGFGAWSRETTLIPCGEPYEKEQLDWKTKKPNGKMLWYADYAAKVRITVDLGDHGPVVFRDGHGFGSGINPVRGAAVEIAIKGAETDAMKRALVTFGNRFGLELYDKDRIPVSGVDESDEEGDRAGPPTPSDAREWDEVPPQLDNRVTPQTYRNGKGDGSSANSAKSLALLRAAIKQINSPTELTRWCTGAKDAIGALTTDQRWMFFSEVIQRGIDLCKTSIDVDVFWTSNEKGLNSLKKGDEHHHRDLENYMAEKVRQLAAKATDGPATLTVLDAG